MLRPHPVFGGVAALVLSLLAPVGAAAAVAGTPLDASLEVASGRFAGVLGEAEPGAAPRFFTHHLPGQAPADGGESAYPVASVTKVFTSAAILVLHDQGRVSLDAPVSTYWPALAGKPSAQVTLRQLLAHQSGVPSVMQNGQGLDATLDPATWPLPTTLDEQLAPVLEMPLRFAPGARYAYSNSGYLMLAKVIEQVAGEPWEAAVARLVLAPAGVDAGACFCADAPGAPDAAPAEWSDGGTRSPIAVHPTRSSAAGALRITPSALMRWLQAMADGRIVKPDTLAQAWAPGKPTRRTGESMGLGWLVRESDGRRIVLHDGTLPGVVATVAIEPATRRVAMGVVTPTLPLASVSTSEGYVRDRVVALLGRSRPKDIPAAGAAPAESIAGRYALPDGRALVLARDAGGWHATLVGAGSPLELRQAARLRTPFARRAQATVDALVRHGQAGVAASLSPALAAALPPGALDQALAGWRARFGEVRGVHVFGANPAQTVASVRLTLERGAVDLGLVYDAEGLAGLQMLGESRADLPTRVPVFATADGALWIDGYRSALDPVALVPVTRGGEVIGLGVSGVGGRMPLFGRMP